MAGKSLSTTCCIVGGGPAGLMLGYLLARAVSRLWSSRSIGIFSATSAATPFIRRRSS